MTDSVHYPLGSVLMMDKDSLKSLARTFVAVFMPIATFVSLYFSTIRESPFPLNITITGPTFIILMSIVVLGIAIVYNNHRRR